MYYTFKRQALAVKQLWQKLRFTRGKGYWLAGTRPRDLPIVMYDSVTPSTIPPTAEAVAGYVNGLWKTYPQLVRDFPHAKKLSIAVNIFADAECLDVETGDATNAEAPIWVRRQIGRGVKRPVVYTSVSNAPALLRSLRNGGISRADIRLWTAHYTDRPHRCWSGCGFGLATVADATQWTNKALGKNLDQSLCSPVFFD